MVSARARSRVKRRKTIRDIGEIVLGVLIALALGAVASEIGWKIEVFQARRAIANELGEIIGQGRERASAERCVEQRLDAIGAIIDRAGTDGRLPATGSLGDPLFRTWSTGVWDATRGAQIASKMSREEQDDLSGVYRIVQVIDRATDEELAAWTELYAIVGPGRPIDASEVAALRNSLARARLAHRQIAISGIMTDRYARSLDLPVNDDAVAQYSRTGSDLLCGPLPAYRGERYGSAPLTHGFARVHKRLGGGG